MNEIEYFDELLKNDKCDFILKVEFKDDWVIVVVHEKEAATNRYEYYISKNGRMTDRGQIWGGMITVMSHFERWIFARHENK